MKKRVLLVDANIKKPSLSASIGLAPNISWVNVVRESLNPAEAIIRCKSTGVCVMPLGDTSDRQVLPQMLLDHLGGLLSSVEDSFDLIVIDTGEARYLPLELSTSANLVDAAMIVDSNVASAPFRQTKENLLSFGITKFVAAQNSI
jgi:Mrp family chromosome partitioning ATPase